MAECPWYVSAHAVRAYQNIIRRPMHQGQGRPVVPGVDLSFDDASDRLIEYAAETWQRYLANPDRQPQISRTGAYIYRGPRPHRLQLVVSMSIRPEGPKGQLVDVVAHESHGR